MSTDDLTPLSADELAAESATALPPKEVMSLLDLNADIDAALHLAAPVDLAVAANANIVAPIEAAVGANVLSVGSTAGALADQHATVDQGLSGTAVAHAPQSSVLDQGTAQDPGTAAPAPTADTGSAVPTDPSSALNGDLLKVDVNANINADAAAPIDGAVAANANVAAPIDGAVSANIGSVDSHATAIASQDVALTQHLDGVTADATAAQQSTIQQ
jgi:hypothetical protein